MYIEPIPLEILTDTVTHKGDFTKDRYGNDTPNVIQTLTNVRVEKNNDIDRSRNGDHFLSYKYILFYDITNSSGLSEFFKPNDIIIYGDDLFSVELKVNDISILKGFEGTHHYEVELV